MIKKLLLASSIGLVLLPLDAFAETDAQVYGRAHLGLRYVDIDNQESETEVDSYSSRFGIKAKHGISDDLSVLTKLEWEVNISEQDGANGSDDNIKSRDQYLGLKSKTFGQILIGRKDTALKKSQNKLDMMNDFVGDIKHLATGENRLGDMVNYQSPKFGQLQFELTYIAEENSKQSDGAGVSAAIGYGDKALKKTPFYVAYAHDEDVAGYNIDRVSAQGKLGDFTINGMYQNSEKVSSGDDGDTFVVSASYKIENYKILVQYQDDETGFGKLKDSGSASSVGVERKLGKQAKAYIWYTQRDLDNSDDEGHLAVTLRYDF